MVRSPSAKLYRAVGPRENVTMRPFAKLGFLVLAGLLAISSVGTLATEKYAQKEDVECTVCHKKAGGKKLTDKGKYYEALHTLNGYDKLTEKFGNCLYCHKRKPGSKRLTKEGKRVREIVKNMDGLFEWLKEGHTGPLE
jgi:hypothetical protein